MRCGGVIFLVLVISPAWAWAQPRPLGSKEDLEKAQSQNAGLFGRLVEGDAKLAGKEEKLVLELTAKYWVYRNTWAIEQDPAKRGELAKHAQRFRDVMARVRQFSDKNQVVAAFFAKELVTCFKEVFALGYDDNRTSVVFTAVLLPYAATGKAEVVGDFLKDLIADEKQPPVVKLYALKGMREFMPLRIPQPGDVPANEAKTARYNKDKERAAVLLAFLERTPDTKDPSAADKDAWVYIRREAVRALAGAQAPALKIDKSGVEAPVAYGLLKVLAPDSKWDPPPTLQEKIEAALGVANLKKMPGYAPEVGIYAVAAFIPEFIDEYRKDQTYFKGGDKEKRVPKLPWKAYAEKFEDAFKEMQKIVDPQNKGLADKVDNFVKLAVPELKGIQRYAHGDDPRLVRQAVATLAPPNGVIYQGNAKLTVDFKKMK